MQVRSAVLFETLEEIYHRVYREVRPDAASPTFRVEFCRFASANSFIRMREGEIRVRITDILEAAPAPIQESLAFILLAKLFRREVPPKYAQRYRRYLNRHEVRRALHLVRQIRGRKLLDPPEGCHYDLEDIFEELNQRFFDGLMARPKLGWSRRASRVALAHYDPSHNSIVVSRALDRPDVPRLVIEYVMFHEMLHLRYPAEHAGTVRRVHTKEFREAERRFPELRKVKSLLRNL